MGGEAHGEVDGVAAQRREVPGRDGQAPVLAVANEQRAVAEAARRRQVPPAVAVQVHLVQREA